MTKNARKSIISRLVRWRMWIQAGFLAVWLDPLMLRMHNVCGPVFHCYSCPLALFACPVGVLANFSALHVFPFVAVGTLLLIGAAIGTFLCGYVCPFGFLQDLAGRVPTPKVRLPSWTGYTRYVVLGLLALAIPYLYGEAHPLFICKLCPAGALEGAVPNVVSSAMAKGPIAWPSTVKLTILGAFLVAIFFTWRPWCTLLCPLGAIYGLFNRASLVFLRYRPEECKACEQCSRLCRYGVLPNSGLNVSRCVRCLECTKCHAISLGSVLQPGGRTKGGTRPGPQTQTGESTRNDKDVH